MWAKKYNNMTVEEYIDAIHNRTEDAEEKISKYNKELLEDYPFLLPRNVWTDKLIEDFDYSFTWLDDLEYGWRIAFGEDLLKELKEELIRTGLMDKYRIHQIKEKFSGLRWYDASAPEKWVDEILPKYEELSYKTCGICGKPAEYISKGWIYPFCADCAEKSSKKRGGTLEQCFTKINEDPIIC